jgi:uncharacterized damage-inducible protein DinB
VAPDAHVDHPANFTMDPRVAPLAEIFRLNTWLFHNCLAGMSAAQAEARLDDRTNSAAFIAAHVADTRFATAAWLGAPLENPLAAALEGARGITDVATLPPLDVIVRAWDDASATIAARLEELPEEALDGPSPQRFPGASPSLLGALAFLAQHDSYHVGQLALLRKAAGLPAMRYAEPRPGAGT